MVYRRSKGKARNQVGMNRRGSFGWKDFEISKVMNSGSRSVKIRDMKHRSWFYRHPIVGLSS